MTSRPPSASSAAITPPPAPEPTTTASQSSTRSRATSSRVKMPAGLRMAQPPKQAVRGDQRIGGEQRLLVAADVGAEALEALARRLGDPGVGVVGEALAHLRAVVEGEGDQRLEA